MQFCFYSDPSQVNQHFIITILIEVTDRIKSVIFYIKKKKFCLLDTLTCPINYGNWYACFGFVVMSQLGLKTRVGSALFAFVIFVIKCDILFSVVDAGFPSSCAQVKDAFPNSGIETSYIMIKILDLLLQKLVLFSL